MIAVLVNPSAGRGRHRAKIDVALDRLREADPDLLLMQFIGPLLFWRHLHAVGDDRSVIRNRHAFARAHVDQFLHGAAAETASPSRVRRARSS